MILRNVDRGLAALSWVAAALVVVLLFAGPALIGAKKSAASGGVGATSYGSGAAGKTSGSGGSAQGAGKAVFASAGCGGCHTLKDAGTNGSTGPDLDQVQPSAADVSQIVRSGSGVMPSFSGKLSNAQITAVASYVSSVAGH